MASTQSRKTSKQKAFVDPRVRFADLLKPVKIPGRPSGYRPEFCRLAIRLGSEGKSRASIAASIGIHRAQLHRWEERYEDFRDAMQEARELAQKWWERIAEEGQVMGGQINTGLWSKSMSARFPEDYTERSELSGPNGGDIPVAVSVEFVGVKPKKEK